MALSMTPSDFHLGSLGGKIMELRFILAAATMLCLLSNNAYAGDIPYNPKVTLKIGQSIILKGVRSSCGKPADGWSNIAKKLPKSKTGEFSNGGTGTVVSDRCGGPTPGRAVKFTATAKGKERLRIYDDSFSVTVQ
jgi:hypothetical protein